MWQDWVLTLTQIIFMVSLVPTILHPTKKPAFITALVTAPTIFVVVYVYFSLELWWSMAAAFILATEWSILAYQRWRLDKVSISN